MDTARIPLTRLLFLPGLLFIVLILVCGYYNRFASDDYLIIASSNEQNPLQFATAIYLTWQGTFFLSILEHVLFHVMQDWKTLIVFHIISLGLLIHGMYLLIRNISARWQSSVGEVGSIPSHRKTLYYGLLSVSWCCCFFFMSHDLGRQSWFLISGSAHYLWPIILVVYSASVVVSVKLKMKTRIVLAGILFFIFGFSTVNSVMITIFLYGSVLLYEFLRLGEKRPGLLSFIWTNRGSTIPFIMLLLGAGLMIGAPGNYVRREEYEFAFSFSSVLLMSFTSILYFIKVAILHKLIYAFFFIFLFSISGFYWKDLGLRAIQVFVIVPLVIIVVILMADTIQAVIMAIAMGRTGPHRTFVLLSLLMSVGCGVMGFCLGNYLKRSSHSLGKWVYLAGILGISTINLKLLIEQYPIIKNYSHAFDKQLVDLKQLSANGGTERKTIYLPPLPESGLLYKLDLAEKVGDKMHGITKAYEKVNDLNVNVFSRSSDNGEEESQ